MTDHESVAQIVDYDHRDKESRQDPWPRWKAMREEHILFSREHGGFFVIPRYRELADALRNTDVFSSAHGTGIPVLPSPLTPPLHADPPNARQWREMINALFSPSRVASYRPWLQVLARQSIDPCLARDGFDVPRDIGIPLTRQIILQLMGVTDAPPQLNEWTDDLIFSVGQKSKLGAEGLMGFLAAEISARRDARGDDLVSSLFTKTLTSQNRLLTDSEIMKLLFLVLIAALETTSSAISAMIGFLVEHPAHVARLLAEPEIWPRAMDEFVRWASPAACLARTTRQDTEIHGCPIPAGSRVLLLYASGNRDETEFPNPDDVVLDRYPNRHLGFGMGPHRCLGSHLAKAQMSVVLECMLPALGAWRIEDPSSITWNASATRGQTSLRLARK
jgi:cytochrome P450